MSVVRANSAIRACVLVVASLVLASARVSAQTGFEPSQLSVNEVQGALVTLTWLAPSATEPDGYVLEGGFAPGEALASLAVGNGTSTQLALLPGVYYVRTYAVSDGVRSGASNEVRVVVGAAAAPSAPDNLRVVAVGNGVSLSWRQTAGGGIADTILLDATGPLTGTIPLGATGSFRADGVPSGVYTLSLRAANAAGVSPSSASVTVTLPGLVVAVERGPTRPPGDAGLPVRFDRFDAPRLQLLAAREGLANVVAGAATEFEGVLRLKDWVAAQFAHTAPDPYYPPWDALIILDAIRGGITGGFCAQFSQVMLQSLAALGLPARYVEIGRTDNPYTHFPLEYWSNQFNKWVLIDVDFNLHFERNGVPLSALDVHDAYVSGNAGSVTVVEGSVRAGHPSYTGWPARTLELYYYLRVHLKADHVTTPNENPFDRWGDMVELLDSRTTPWESSPVPSEWPKERLTARSTDDRGLVYAPLNQIWVTPRVTGGTAVVLDLAHDMPQIAAVEYRVIDTGGAAGPWLRHYSPTLTWLVGPDDRAIEVRGVNLRGIIGPATRLALVAR